MAIDTATKRASALLDLGQIPFPPDGTIAAADRGFMLEFYGGIAADEPEAIIPITPWEKAMSDRAWRKVTEDANWNRAFSDRSWRAKQ